MSAQLSDLMERGVKELGLTSLRARMVHAIFLLGPLRQRQLSEAMGCSAQQVAAVLDVLEEKDLIERQPDPSDRRAHQVSLTKKGASLAHQIESHRSIAADWLLKDIPREDLEAFVSVTRHIRQQTAVSPSV
ncbi:MarR family winged helix-turn-helix transcriptional regulator [Rhodococcus maanshanensis]|uniref:MarR family winged helix-turn-helix transcriptional regulator n=1 Tax=Rhodococcus maanshanensis TaxID=183556 RepID=UPI0022B3CC37|nr:MarR family transcriptional regulator [Rhodococcus maanshanensis]